MTFNSTGCSKILNATAEVQINIQTDPNACIVVVADFRVIKITHIYGYGATAPTIFDPLVSLDPISVDINETSGTVLSFSELGSALKPPAK